MIEIRYATPADAHAIQEIYRPYVMNTAITFDYEVPSLEDFRRRIASTLLRFPYLLAVENDYVLGYAYAGPLRNRAAYDWSAETSIYIRLGHHHNHVGFMLYIALEEELKRRGICNLYACITASDEDEKYVPKISPLFHERMGFQTVGHFHRCGKKFNRWFDILWMEKIIGDHKAMP